MEWARGEREWFSHFNHKDSLGSHRSGAANGVLWTLLTLTLEQAVVHHTPELQSRMGFDC